MFCLQCGNEIKENVNFCVKCGWTVPMAEAPVFCTNCGTKIEDDSQFCTNCGQAVQTGANANAAPVMATPVQPPTPAPEETVFCTNCGSRIPKDSVFCKNCGRAVNDAPKGYATPIMATPNIPVQKSSMDAIGLVLGIICVVGVALASAVKDSFVVSFFVLIAPFMLGIAGVILSAIACLRNKKAHQPIYMAIAGLVVSIIGIIYLLYRVASLDTTSPF